MQNVVPHLHQDRNDGYADGSGPYEPYMIGYDPYWTRWYLVPIYYYSLSDGDNDCDDGNCNSGNAGHGGHHKPLPGTGTGTTPPGAATHPMPVVGIPHVSSAQAVASEPSGGSGNGGDFGRGGGFGRSGSGGARGGLWPPLSILGSVDKLEILRHAKYGEPVSSGSNASFNTTKPRNILGKPDGSSRARQ